MGKPQGLLDKFAEALLGAFLTFMQVETPEQLVGLAAKAVRDEFADDIQKLEDAPDRIADKLLARLPNFADIPGQIVAQLKRNLPFPFNQ